MARLFSRRKARRPEKIGLALGSGSARGWAHIGVINALTEAGVRVDCVAGTSIGSLVGAVFASGKMASLETVVREMDWRKALALFDMGLPRSGLLDGRHITSAIREHVGCGGIEELTMPFCAVSTDLYDGSEVHIKAGDVIEAVRASISIPGVFTPVKKDGRLLVDGGLVNPVPASVVRNMGADYVIAVDLNHGAAGIGSSQEDRHETPLADGAGRGETSTAERLKAQVTAIGEKLNSQGVPGFSHAREWFADDSIPNILEVVISSLTIMEMQIAEMQLAKDPPDLLLRPTLGHVGPMEFHRGLEAIEEGRRAAEEALEQTDVGPLV